MKRFSTFLLVALFATISTLAQSVGSTAQGFTLNKLSGGSGSLSDYQGKVVLVFLFGNSCSSCIAVSSTVKSSLLDEFSNDPNFVAIGMDVWNGSASQVQNFKNRTGLNIDLFLNASGVAQSWGTSYDRLVVIRPDGKFAFIGSSLVSTSINSVKSVLVSELDNVSTSLDQPKQYLLNQNYPNPFSYYTTIPIELNEPSNVVIDVLDVSGKLITKLADDNLDKGLHTFRFNRENLNSGIYFYRIKTGSVTETRMMTIR